MKKVFLTTGLALFFSLVTAQTEEKSYIVKTRNVEKPVVTAQEGVADSAAVEEEETALNFVSKNFKYYSLCNWKKGMKFMVMPEKYDLVVNTFTDSALNKEVSSMKLRHHIMIYKGHYEGPNGRARINFLCQDDKKTYYFELPGAKSFEDYCGGKYGVPTLAYLGDVDIARELLTGKTMYTKTKVYRVDTENDGDGYREIMLKDLNQEVKVTKVGVGSRSFPVKIIVEDKDGNEFYQTVAMSKTNSGMRDDEFGVDSIKHTFYGAFELMDEEMSVSKDIASYEGKIVHTVQVTPMTTYGDGKEREVKVPRMLTFKIEKVSPQKGTPYVILSLQEQESLREYFVKVTFLDPDDKENRSVVEISRNEYFGYIFAMGEGDRKETTPQARAAIRKGRVIVGMSEDEVILAMGEEPDGKNNMHGGKYQWVYLRSKGKSLIVNFNRLGRVESYQTAGEALQTK